jgi:adenylosuccinate synthase
VFKGDVFDDEGSVRLGKGNNGKHVFYEDMDGWSGTRGVREFGALHENAQAFYNRIGEIAGLPVEYIGTGPEHDDLIVRKI